MREKKALVFLRMVMEPRKLEQAWGMLKRYARRRRTRAATMVRMDAHARVNALRRTVRWVWKYRRLKEAKVREGGSAQDGSLCRAMVLCVCRC
jgi:hypothetical protein